MKVNTVFVLLTFEDTSVLVTGRVCKILLLYDEAINKITWFIRVQRRTVALNLGLDVQKKLKINSLNFRT